MYSKGSHGDRCLVILITHMWWHVEHLLRLLVYVKLSWIPLDPACQEKCLLFQLGSWEKLHEIGSNYKVLSTRFICLATLPQAAPG